jgi:hypothetical protein
MLADPARLAAVDRMLPVAIAAREALDRLARRGRGLEVIGTLAEQLDIRPGQTGTVVRFRIGGPPASSAPAAEVSRDQQVEGGG